MLDKVVMKDRQGKQVRIRRHPSQVKDHREVVELLLRVSNPSHREDGDTGHELLITEREHELLENTSSNSPPFLVGFPWYKPVYKTFEFVERARARRLFDVVDQIQYLNKHRGHQSEKGSEYESNNDLA